MAYRKIEAKFRLEVVKEYWITSNVSQIAKKYGVGRNAVYEWSDSAEKCILENFTTSTPGKRTVSPVEENRKLKEQLRELLDDYHRLSQKVGIESTVSSEVILSCPKCTSEHTRKNGTVYTKTHGLRQRVSCRVCSFSIYVALKKTL